jgi:hypothetical protein
MDVVDGTMWFRVMAPLGNGLHYVDLHFATQLDTVP